MKQKYLSILFAVLLFIAQPLLAADTFLDYTPITTGIGAGQTVQPSHLLNNFSPISTSINNLNNAGRDTNTFKDAIELSDYIRSFNSSATTGGSGFLNIPNEALKVYVKATDSVAGGWGAQSVSIPSGYNFLWAQISPSKTYLTTTPDAARPANSVLVGGVQNNSGVVTFDLVGTKPWEEKSNFFQGTQQFQNITVRGSLSAPNSDINPTGAIFMYGLNCPNNSIALQGQTIGNSASGANQTGDFYKNLFIHLWDVTNLPILDFNGNPTTRGASALADYNSAKRLTVYDIRGRFIAGAGAGSGLTNRPLNTIGGAESVSHNHTISGTAAAHDSGFTGSAFNGGGLGFSYSGTAHTHSVSGTTSSTNTSTIPPYLALNFCIRTDKLNNRKILIVIKKENDNAKIALTQRPQSFLYERKRKYLHQSV